jgi:hypothetical protein
MTEEAFRNYPKDQRAVSSRSDFPRSGAADEFIS